MELCGLWLCGVGDLILFFVWTGRTEEGWKLCEITENSEMEAFSPIRPYLRVALTKAISFLSNKWASLFKPST